MNLPDRIAKLRRMAEHPRSNTNEAALARAELERLERDHPSTAARFTMRTDARPLTGEDIDELFIKHGAPADWVRANSIAQAWRERDNRQARGQLCPGDAGYYEWARKRAVGERLLIWHTSRWDKPISHSVIVPDSEATIDRLTATVYVMSDGTRFRRVGEFPGYKVGENGRSGRTFIVRAP